MAWWTGSRVVEPKPHASWSHLHKDQQFQAVFCVGEFSAEEMDLEVCLVTAGQALLGNDMDMDGGKIKRWAFVLGLTAQLCIAATMLFYHSKEAAFEENCMNLWVCGHLAVLWTWPCIVVSWMPAALKGSFSCTWVIVGPSIGMHPSTIAKNCNHLQVSSLTH